MNIFGLGESELAAALTPLRVPAYRARQIAAWMYQRGVADFNGMSDLPKPLRAALAERLTINRGECARSLTSANGDTTKILLRFGDGNAVETVLMRHDYGTSVCLSTQVGCAMGCAFCASTVGGFVRDLSVGELLAQFVHWRAAVGKVDSLVLMGTGEPLLNLDNVLAFLRRLHDTFNFGYRNVALSTCGIVPNLARLADARLPLTLSISLHAPTDELRSRLMPVNRRYPLRELLAAARAYAERTKRRVTYEYILLAGVNDSEAQAKALGELLRGQLAAVNLIPFNDTSRDAAFRRPTSAAVMRFASTLERFVAAVTVRREMGADIAAACGQLRRATLDADAVAVVT